MTKLLRADPLAARALLDASVSEDELQGSIEKMLDWRHLLHFHDEDARRDDAGLPDLIFPIPPILHLWELKTMSGRMKDKQIEWGEALKACTEIDYRIVRPSELSWVKRYLGLGD